MAAKQGLNILFCMSNTTKWIPSLSYDPDALVPETLVLEGPSTHTSALHTRNTATLNAAGWHSSCAHRNAGRRAQELGRCCHMTRAYASPPLHNAVVDAGINDDIGALREWGIRNQGIVDVWCRLAPLPGAPCGS
jgi:hypothetical protein